jgi:hypothetical protein
MNCPHCFQQVAPESVFCPYCGARLGELSPTAPPEAADDPTYGALAQANLLRLRGDWSAAREKTVGVLREYPNSGTAHSLMGDIFADQELYEDAAEWYRMALDLEPDNVADERKLATAEARIAESEPPAKAESADAPPAFAGFRVAAWAGGAFLVLVIALGIWLSQMNPSRTTNRLPDVTPRVSEQPSNVAPTPQTTQPGTAPGTVPAPPGSAAPTEVPPTGDAPPAAASDAAPGETQGEAAVRARLADLGGTLASDGLRLADLAIDPRMQSAAITLDGAGVNGAAEGWMDAVYRGALAVAARALTTDKTLARVHVRVVMPLTTPAGVVRDVAFIGDATRPAGFDTVPNATLTHFDRRWWHAGILPPPALATTP